MEKALVFNIQKFSVDDGPGIRTVVFLKGCPLRCQWCANPESQSQQPQILWDRETSSGEEPTMDSRWMTTEEVFQECMKDIAFYEESDGGVTVSGGEALLWPDFVIELFEMLHAEGIRTAVETAGYVSEEDFTRVSPHVDLFLFDMKHWDATQHRAGTGVSIELILRNMRRAVKMGKEVLPRIPVIPGFNDTEEDARRFAALLKEIGLPFAQLLPFHQFGERKYDLLGQPYAYKNVKNLHREDLQPMLDVMNAAGVAAFVA